MEALKVFPSLFLVLLSVKKGRCQNDFGGTLGTCPGMSLTINCTLSPRYTFRLFQQASISRDKKCTVVNLG